MTDPLQEAHVPVSAEIRWAAMRLLLADLLAANRGQQADLLHNRAEFIAALRSGANVRDLAALAGMSRDQVVAVLAWLVRE